MPMHLLKWLQPGYNPEGGGKKRGKNKTKPPRHLPRMYKAFNVHGDTLPRDQEDRPEKSEGGEGPSEGQHAKASSPGEMPPSEGKSVVAPRNKRITDITESNGSAPEGHGARLSRNNIKAGGRVKNASPTIPQLWRSSDTRWYSKRLGPQKV